MYVAAVIAPLSPMRVHERAFGLTGHRAYWHRADYHGGLYDTHHFRTCSYCGCIHPGDMIELLRMGGRLEQDAKPGKFNFFTPNPVAGNYVHMGSCPGRVFDKQRWPQDLKHHLYADAAPALRFAPTIGERLTGHFERPALEPAPAEIKWPFYAEHTNEKLWPEIWAAAQHGSKSHEVPSA